MGRSPRDNNFAILARIVWAWCPHAALMNSVMKGTTYLPICKKFEIFAANWCWWIGHLSPKCILVGPTIALIIRINVWAMQLIKLPFPCSNTWNKSRCWEHSHCYHLPLGVKYWVWCNYTTIYQFDLLPFTTKWSTRGAFSRSNISWGSWNENTPNDEC